MSIYLDASFLVSMYANDENLLVAAQLVQSTTELLLLTDFGELEAVNALELRVFRKAMTRVAANSCLRIFSQDIEAGVLQLEALPVSVFSRARELSLRTTATLGTRTPDLLHVAAALELGASGFYSFDKQQRRLAESVKLSVNPQPLRED